MRVGISEQPPGVIQIGCFPWLFLEKYCKFSYTNVHSIGDYWDYHILYIYIRMFDTSIGDQ